MHAQGDEEWQAGNMRCLSRREICQYLWQRLEVRESGRNVEVREKEEVAVDA